VVIGAFAAAVPEAATASAPSAPTSTAVRSVQQQLAALKFLATSQVDGKLGPRTKHAITAFQQWSGLTPDGIAGPQTLAKLRTAAPPTAGKTGPLRRIEIYRAKGVTMLIDHGKVNRVIHSSAGKRGYETPTGSYRIVRRVLMDWSRPYKSWMPYASYFVGGYALHEGAVPTYPASHGCVRLPAGDAADVYRFATVTTAVIVYR
jgi:lipoprotein-anchoring transpeptidase ErfK/SrfK